MKARAALTVGGGDPRGLFAAALARAGSWLLEPAESDEHAGAVAGQVPEADCPSPVVAVFGLARRCGNTMVARALAAELALREEGGAAAVASDEPAPGITLALASAGRLSRALEDLPGARTRAVGRLCVIAGADPLALARAARETAPLVIDAGAEGVGGAPAAVADHVLLVATPEVDPALAEIAAACVSRVGPEPLFILNRARGASAWDGSQPVCLPEARLGARLAAGGREAHGELGRAVAALADLCERPR